MRRSPPTNDEEQSPEVAARRCRATALDLLARRDFGRRELGLKLQTRGFDADIVEGVLAALVDEGLLNEARHAESFVAARSGRGQGPARIRTALRGKGLPAEQIEQALTGSEVDWRKLAERVRRRKFGEARPADIRERARQYRFLVGRGFSAEQVRSLLEGPAQDWDVETSHD